MAGTWTPGGPAWAGDTLTPAEGLPEWLRRSGWHEAAAIVEAGAVAEGSPAALLLQVLREAWLAHCAGRQMSELRVIARPLWVLVSGGAG